MLPAAAAITTDPVRGRGPTCQFPFQSRAKLMSRPAQSRSTPMVNASAASDSVDAMPEISTKPLKKRRRLSRDRFDALYRASRKVDADLLQQVGPVTNNDPSESDRLAKRMAERVRLNRRSVSSLLFSFVTHLALILVLALFLTIPTKEKPTIGLDASFISSPIEIPPEPEDAPEPIKINAEAEVKDESPIESTATDLANELVNERANEVDRVPSPTLATDSNPMSIDVKPSVVGNLPTRPTGGGLQGRNANNRAALAGTRGGTKGSEAAVERGLRWIVQHQRPDGSWRLFHNVNACQGHCRNEGKIESPTAATGLALMSLLGAGYTHEAGPYQLEVRAGLEFLIDKMRVGPRGGNLTISGGGKANMYAQAIATIALSEAWAMTSDPALEQPVREAQKYICTSQNEFNGSWGYQAGQSGDLTITGWQIAALKSCKLAGIQVDPVVWDKARKFVESTSDTSGLFGYKRPVNLKVSARKRDYRVQTTTAAGTLAQMYMGAPLETASIRNGINYLAKEDFSPTDIYFNYYATQVFRHFGGEDWKQWNAGIRKHLVDTQDQSSSHARGSWYFPDTHGKVGGRLYTTAMAVMTLEVYYRYLPLYGEASLTDEEVPIEVERRAELELNLLDP